MTRTCSYCGETSPASMESCPSCGRSFTIGQIEQVMTPPHGVLSDGGGGADALYTRLALKAVDLSDTFNALFEQPMPGWRVEMTRPGMSTAGGKQSLQHIGLRGSGGGTIVIGSLDPGAARAELRSYRLVDAMFRQRYRRPIPIRAPDWERFAQRIVQFLREEGLTVSVDSGADARDADTEEIVAPGGRWPVLWLVVGGLLIALVAGAITWVVLTQRAAPVGPEPGPPATGWTAPGASPPLPALPPLPPAP